MEPKPNYEVLFKSSVAALQKSYDQYKTARILEIRYTGFGNDGRYHELEGVREFRVEASERSHEVRRLQGEVEKYRKLMEGESNAE